MRTRIVVAGATLVVLALALAALFVYRYLAPGRAGRQSGPASYAFITNPLNSDILFVSDPVYVGVQAALVHRNPGEAALYVDGQPYALDEQAQAFAPRLQLACPSGDASFCGSLELSLLWIPAQAGAHQVSACVFGDQSSTPAWQVCTEPVTVAVVDRSAPAPEPAGTYALPEAASLAEVASGFGLPPQLIAAANPGIDPDSALPRGTQLSIPKDPSVSPAGSSAASAASAWTVDEAKMTAGQPIDKGYCYYSLGSNFWSRIPAGPQTFAYPLDGQLDLTSELRGVSLPAAGGTLSMECWGWSGATLVSLGSGQTRIQPGSAQHIALTGDDFSLNVDLVPPPGKLQPQDIKYQVPPPMDLTGTNNVDVCIEHTPPDSLFLVFLCKAAVESGDPLLVWEWLTPLFAPDTPGVVWLTKIDGYHVYEVPAGGKPKLIQTIPDAGQKVWDAAFLKKLIYDASAPPAFFVRAYAGALESANSNLYVYGGVAPGLATVTIDPSYASSGGENKKREDSGCTAGLDGILLDSSELVVGFTHNEPEDSCVKYYWEYARAQVGFDLAAVKGPVSSAWLTYKQDSTSLPGASCANELRVVTSTSSGALKDLASDPYRLLPGSGVTGTAFKEDVTDAVRDWTLGATNSGFLLRGRDESLPADCGGLLGPGCIGGGSLSCWSGYSGARLTVTYFTTP
jgi:hypothetical protein